MSEVVKDCFEHQLISKLRYSKTNSRKYHFYTNHLTTQPNNVILKETLKIDFEVKR